MGKVLLIISTLILLSVSGNCQWLNRHYGVNDFNQLSKKQLNDALRKVNNGVKCGTILSVTGVIGIGSGIIIILANQDKDFGGLGGLVILEASIPIEIAGLLIIHTNNKRKTNIREVLKNAELGMGLVNYQWRNICASTRSSFSPCLSVTIRF
jgi:hypothetical protein